MSVKAELHRLVDELSTEDAEDMLTLARRLAQEAAEPDTLSEDELAEMYQGEDEIARGAYVSLRELRRSLAR